MEESWVAIGVVVVDETVRADFGENVIGEDWLLGHDCGCGEDD